MIGHIQIALYTISWPRGPPFLIFQYIGNTGTKSSFAILKQIQCPEEHLKLKRL